MSLKKFLCTIGIGFKVCSIVNAATVAANGAVCGVDFVIAERGAPPNCSIVVDGNAGELERYAATELQTFTKRMTGVELQICTNGVAKADRAVVLRCGGDCASPDSFRLKTDGNRFGVTGGGPRGVLYGTYELLQRFGGCEWFSSWVEEVPKRDAFAVPGDLDEFEKPAFDERHANWRDTFASPAFAARMRFQGQFHRKFPCGGPALRFVNGLGFQLAHTYGRLVPAKQHFAEHPEWYSMVGGRRLGPDDQWQICWSDKGLQRFMVERIKELLRADPGARAVGVSQNDWTNYCQCPECAACTKAEGSPAGPNIRFVNIIAEELEKEFPGVMVETLAYHGTRVPPKTIRPRHNVIVCLCSFECSFSVPFEKSPHPNTAKFRQYLREWGGICRNLYIWDYTTNFTNYLSPFTDVYSLQPNYKLFRDNGVRWLFAQGSDTCPHADGSELKCYLQSKLMWNPDQPVEPLINRFMAAFYGNAAPLVKQYMADLYTALNLSPYRDPDPDAAPAWCGIYGENVPLSDDFVEKALETWRLAEDAVKDDPVRLYNVRVGALPMMFVRLKRLYEKSYKTVWAAEDLAPHLERFATLQSAAADFIARADEVKKAKKGDIYLSEGGARSRWLMGDFRSLAAWRPPAAGSARAEVSTNAMTFVKRPRAWRLPIRLIACDVGAKYKVRAHLKAGKGFSHGIEVPGLPLAKGTVRKTVAADGVSDGWVWCDLGEYDFSELQKLPRPTMYGPCLYVSGDIELDKLEIAR